MFRGGRFDDAALLRSGEAARTLEDEARARSYNPQQRAVRSLDLAQNLLDRGDGNAAARFLEAEANRLQNTGDPVLRSYRDNALSRAAGYRATVPAQGYERASELARRATEARTLAHEMRRQGREGEARFLEAMGTDSLVQARLLAASAGNTDALVGRGLVQTYRAMVDHAYQTAIDGTGTLFGAGRRDGLVRDRDRTREIFGRLDTMMQEQGIGLDRAWNQMFENARINSGFAGFPTARDAAIFLRDNQHSMGLLIPFADMAQGFHRGDDAAVERARAGLVTALRDRRQWDVADQLYQRLQGEARTREGRQALDNLGTGRAQWWGQTAGDFIQHELPLLVLSGVVSGGAGWAARAGGAALGWGVRASRAVGVATELGAFVPTQRVLGELLQGRRADWSPGALARDYALTLGGYGLFRGMGSAWRYFRGDRAGAAVAREGLEHAFQGAGPRAAAGGARPPVPLVTAPTAAEATQAARAARDLRAAAGHLAQNPQEVQAALRNLQTPFQVNWGQPAQIGRSELARVQQYARDLARANPHLTPQQALDFAAADFMNSGRAVNYFRDPATGQLHMPGGINFYGNAPVDAAVEQAIMRAHGRMLIEEYAHGFGYSIRPGAYTPLTPQMQQFQGFMQTWMADPANQAALAQRYGAHTLDGLRAQPHEADIMALLGGMNPFEVDRYAIRLVMEEFMRLRPQP
jgi:hypothetical protein